MLHARSDYNHIQDPANRIPDQEPVFLLRGQDANAPATVDRWADLAEQGGADPEIVAIAREHADRMRTWQEFVRCKVPDLPQG